MRTPRRPSLLESSAAFGYDYPRPAPARPPGRCVETQVGLLGRSPKRRALSEVGGGRGVVLAFQASAAASRSRDLSPPPW